MGWHKRGVALFNYDMGAKSTLFAIFWMKKYFVTLRNTDECRMYHDLESICLELFCPFNFWGFCYYESHDWCHCWSRNIMSSHITVELLCHVIWQGSHDVAVIFDVAASHSSNFAGKLVKRRNMQKLLHSSSLVEYGEKTFYQIWAKWSVRIIVLPK